MGPLFSRFRRKPTTVELLEAIDKEINRLQRNRKVNQDRQKQFVTSLLTYSIAAYVIAAVIFFCICFPETWQLRLLYCIPLLIFPVLVWIAKRSLHWYFVQRISSNDAALEELRDTRNQILEEVMDTQTYKKAREILEKFDTARLHQLQGIPDNMSGLARSTTPELGSAGTMIQQRTFRPAAPLPTQASPAVLEEQNGAPHLSSFVQEQNGAPHLSFPPLHENLRVSQNQAVIGSEFAQPPRPPMPRSVLPRDRGVMDKLMDYLVGDGPENRYALICQHCFSHNGMALKEEFEYFSFCCCYCYCINPAKKQRPTAPRLQFFAPPGMRPADNAVVSSDPEPAGNTEESLVPEPAGNTEESLVPEPAGNTEESLVPEPAGNTEESLVPEPAGNTEESLVPEPAGNTEESLVPEPAGNTEESLVPEPAGNTEESLVPEPGGSTLESLVSEPAGNTEESLVPEPAGNTEESLVPVAAGNTQESLVPVAAGNTHKSLITEPAGNTDESLASEPAGNTEESLVP